MPLIPSARFFRESEDFVKDIPSPYTKPATLTVDDEFVSELRAAVSDILHLISTQQWNEFSKFVSLIEDNTTVSVKSIEYLRDNSTNIGDDFINRLNSIHPFLFFMVDKENVCFKQTENTAVDSIMDMFNWSDEEKMGNRTHAMVQKRIIEQFYGICDYTENINFMNANSDEEFEEVLRSRDFHEDMRFLDSEVVDGIIAAMGEDDELDAELVELLEQENNLQKYLAQLHDEFEEFPSETRDQTIEVSKKVEHYEGVRTQVEDNATKWVDASKPGGAVKQMSIVHVKTELEGLIQSRLWVDRYCEDRESADVGSLLKECKITSENILKESRVMAQLELSKKKSNLYAHKYKELNGYLQQYTGRKVEEDNQEHRERVKEMEEAIRKSQKTLEKKKMNR